MGLMYIDGIVSGPSGATRTVRFLVDSGAKYSLLPTADWQALGLTPMRRATFVLADVGLVLHPFSRTLQPARLLLA